MPADIERYLDADQFKLYALIWKRAVACQMAHAVFDTVAVDMLAGNDGPTRHLLRANGSTLVKPGYIAVYQEGRDDAAEDDGDHMLPAMQVGDAVRLVALHPEQHFTEPPPRYTEASLVKALEEHGIGRPSTYASIISTLRDREYVEIDNRRFTATDIGRIVGKFLTQHFHRYVEYGFTAAMEDELDAVARGEEPWTVPLTKFWKPFIDQVELIEKIGVARTGRAGARAGTRPGQRQAGHGAHGPLRAVRADRHQGRRREAALCGPAAGPEDGHDPARRRLRAVQAAAHARRRPARRRDRADRDRPLRSRTSSTAPSMSR